jgi:hypothetical protein
MNDYRQTRSELVTLNDRLSNLGAEPIVVPDTYQTENLADLILARLQRLRAAGKI